MAIKPPNPGPKPGDPMFSDRPVLGIKPKPVKPTFKTPKPGVIYDPIRTVLPGKPGDLKKSMPSFLRKTKPVTRRGVK